MRPARKRPFKQPKPIPDLLRRINVKRRPMLLSERRQIGRSTHKLLTLIKKRTRSERNRRSNSHQEAVFPAFSVSSYRPSGINTQSTAYNNAISPDEATEQTTNITRTPVRFHPK